MTQDILEVQGVSKRFGAVTALDAVDAAFGRGEFVCILGPSGCGKSTLLRLVAGFDAPDSGRILLEGKDMQGVQPENRHVNMVFQNYALFPHLTVGDNVAFGLRVKKMPAGKIQQQVSDALEMVQMQGLEKRYPRQLSGGQQQRVALARAIINRPGVLLLDEPLAALDKNLRLAMQVELRGIQQQLGITFLHVTHDQAEALTLSDRVMIMRDGIIEQVGAPQEVYNRPKNRFIAAFLGTSNLFSGKWDAASQSVVLAGGQRFFADNETLPATDSDPIELMIRPERIDIYSVKDTDLPETNCVPGTVRQVVYAGAETLCQIAIEGQELLVQLLNRDSRFFHSGDRVHIYLPPQHIVRLSGESSKPAATGALE